jgi:predicted MarR family transcription regulator
MMESIGGRDAYEVARTWHLAVTPRDERVTAFEFAMMQVNEAYQRWVVQAQRLVGQSDITFNEIVVLHVVRMQERAKDAATIAKLVNRDDLPNVLYNLRKLVSIGLVEKVKIGSSTLFQVTDLGLVGTDRYAALRQRVLLEDADQVTNVDDKLDQAIRLLHTMTGLYDSAARETAVLNPATMFANVPASNSATNPETPPATTKSTRRKA